MERKQFGSIYVDGAARHVGVRTQITNISIGDTVKDGEILWNQIGSMLVAAQVVAFNISWAELDRLGYIFGKKIEIDGRPYWCRSLKVGVTTGDTNEWDVILGLTGDDDDLWHWRGAYFWGQESVPEHSTRRVTRGFKSARYRSRTNYTSDHFPHIGFRPVLEPLFPVPENFNPLLTSHIEVVGPEFQSIFGTLVGCTDYDLVLSSPAIAPPENCSWAVKDGPRTVVDRSQLTWLKGGLNSELLPMTKARGFPALTLAPAQRPSTHDYSQEE